MLLCQICDGSIRPQLRETPACNLDIDARSVRCLRPLAVDVVELLKWNYFSAARLVGIAFLTPKVVCAHRRKAPSTSVDPVKILTVAKRLPSHRRASCGASGRRGIPRR